MKLIFKILVTALFLALIAMGFISCSGARKVNKQQSKEQTQIETSYNSTTERKSEANAKTTTTVKVDDKDETVTEETITEPIDASKESFVIEKDGTKLILNNAKKIVRKTTSKNNTTIVSDVLQDETKKEVIKEHKNIKQVSISKKENNSKAIDKKQYNPFNLIIIGFVSILFLWVIYRFYKKLPLVPRF